MKNEWIKKAIIVVVLLAIAAASFFGLSKYTSDPQNHADTIAYLDEEKDTVMEMSAAAFAASMAVNAVPGDTTSAIGEKIADVGGYFILAVGALYLEKYLLTLLGLLCFGLLVPAGCVCLILYFLAHKPAFLQLGMKVLALGLVLYCVVPASVLVSQNLEKTYSANAEVMIEEDLSAEIAVEEEEAAAEVEEEPEAVVAEEEPAASETNEDKGWWGKLTDWASNTVEDVADTVTETAAAAGEIVSDTVAQIQTASQEAIDNAREKLNDYIELCAITIVRICVMPLLTMWFFLWVAKLIAGFGTGMIIVERPHPEKHHPEKQLPPAAE